MPQSIIIIIGYIIYSPFFHPDASLPRRRSTACSGSFLKGLPHSAASIFPIPSVSDLLALSFFIPQAMLHQCGHQSSVCPCSCGFVYGGGGGGASSFLHPVTTTQQFMQEGCDSDEYSGCSSPSSVDCTLSLGTPSTRQTEHKASESSAKIQRPSSCMWDIRSQSKNSSMGSNASPNGGGSALGGDPQLFARRCANCDTTSTPLWRNGPRGPKSLCNACGIRFKKEERRAAASTEPHSSSPVAGEFGYRHRQNQAPWSCYANSSAIKSSSSLTLYDDVVDNGEAPCPSWQFNIAPPEQFSVRDRPSLSQYN